MRRIARMAGISTSTARAALGAMRKKHWLSWSSGNAKESKANTYTLYLNAIPMLPNLWRSSLQTCGDYRYRPVADPVATTATDLWRLEAKPVAVAGHQASTEANTNTKNTHTSDDVSSVSHFQSQLKPVTLSKSTGNEFVDLWNSRSAPCEPVDELTPQRAGKLRTMIQRGLTRERFLFAIAKLKTSPFCMGEGPNKWRASFDWLIDRDNLNRVIEGMYDRPKKRTMAIAESYKNLAQHEEKR